ncbi:MAG TPA: hypothetical protein VMT87_09810 [Vicinamibacteria bacterium]|nr:hypothetical protein [Vicinamibacteria bacterium]
MVVLRGGERVTLRATLGERAARVDPTAAPWRAPVRKRTLGAPRVDPAWLSEYREPPATKPTPSPTPPAESTRERPVSGH